MGKHELEEAFIAMIRRYERTIYKVCVCYTSLEWPLADLYQESVCRLWAGFPKFRQECSLSTWVYRVTLNICLTGVRRSIRRPQSVPLVSNLAEALAEPEQMEEELREMYALIRRLGPLERTVVLLYLEENSYQQIADITGLTLCNVATKLKRAKIKLRQMVNA